MELSNHFSIQEISNKNTVASANDRNSSDEYNSVKVINFIKNNTNDMQKIIEGTFLAMGEDVA